MRLIAQKDNLGCSIACVASLCEVSYETAKKDYFKGLGDANKRGFLCKEIVKALGRAGKEYAYRYLKGRIKYTEGSIIFIKRSKSYPQGHFLLKASKGWMDPWVNFSKDKGINNAKAGFRKRLPGKAIYQIYEK